MAGTYLYAVIPGTEQTVFPVDGVDGGGAVSTISHGGLAAVVSASPRNEYHGLPRDEAVRYLMTHQQVVERVMESTPLLPVKFGTVLPDEERVCAFLARGEGLFRANLEKYAGLKQMEVVVLWNLEEIFQAIGQEEPIAQLKAELATRPAEETKAERISAGQMVQASLERRLLTLRDRLLPALREVALDLLVNPAMNDSVVANVALLVDDAKREALERRLEQLDQDFGGRLYFRCVGPLPPYSFATVEAQVPSFEAVDAARRRLGLGEAVTATEIKQGYRRVARQAHPDVNRDHPEAEARMAELTRAYDFLSNYAAGQGQEATKARQVVCRFDRPSVERTVLVTVRRQEMAA